MQKQLWLVLAKCTTKIQLSTHSKTKTVTGSLMSFRHDGGRKLPLAAGKTPISCSSGLNCKKEKNFQIRHNFYLSQNSTNVMALNTQAYRFSTLLKIRRHVCNTFKVWSKWCIMKWIIPLPGSTALKSVKTNKQQQQKQIYVNDGHGKDKKIKLSTYNILLIKHMTFGIHSIY